MYVTNITWLWQSIGSQRSQPQDSIFLVVCKVTHDLTWATDKMLDVAYSCCFGSSTFKPAVLGGSKALFDCGQMHREATGTATYFRFSATSGSRLLVTEMPSSYKCSINVLMLHKTFLRRCHTREPCMNCLLQSQLNGFSCNTQRQSHSTGGAEVLTPSGAADVCASVQQLLCKMSLTAMLSEALSFTCCPFVQNAF